MGAEDDDDISPTLAAKSDQLNADDLIGGPIVVRIEDVARGDEDQPVVIHISGGHQPWKPSKTARRCLATCWGPHARTWIGRSVELYRDPEVMFGGVKVGGIRVKAASGIDKPVTVMLASTRGKKAAHRIEVLKVEPPKSSAPGQPDLRAWLNEANLSDDDLRDFMAAQSGRPVPPLDQWQATWFADILKRLDGAWGQALPGWLAARNGNNAGDGDGWGGDAA